MAQWVLDRPGLVFVSATLPLVGWAVLGTQRFLRVLSLGRRTAFSRRELMIIRVPGTVCLVGMILLILVTVLHGA
jgi:hypothetical protein